MGVEPYYGWYHIVGSEGLFVRILISDKAVEFGTIKGEEEGDGNGVRKRVSIASRGWWSDYKHIEWEKLYDNIYFYIDNILHS